MHADKAKAPISSFMIAIKSLFFQRPMSWLIFAEWSIMLFFPAVFILFFKWNPCLKYAGKVWCAFYLLFDFQFFHFFITQCYWLFLCSVQSQYNAYRAGITSAIVVAVAVPIGICLWCLLLHLRRKGFERGEEKRQRFGGFQNFRRNDV